LPGIKVDYSSKSYKDAVDDLIRKTEVKSADLDAKFFQLLDKLQQKERAEDGLVYLSTSLDGMDRERIFNWRAYVYTLLRKFDEAAYSEIQTSEDVVSMQIPASPPEGGTQIGQMTFNLSAPEFVPGVYWSGRLIGTTPKADPVPDGFALSFHVPYPEVIVSPPPKGSTGGLDANSTEKELQEASSPSRRLCLSDAVAESPSLAEPVFTPGSEGHELGTCKPCAFLHTKGCANGAECTFCHLCGPEEKKRRKQRRKLEMTYGVST
jgi:hypothetical protein